MVVAKRLEQRQIGALRLKVADRMLKSDKSSVLARALLLESMEESKKILFTPQSSSLFISPLFDV